MILCFDSNLYRVEPRLEFDPNINFSLCTVLVGDKRGRRYLGSHRSEYPMNCSYNLLEIIAALRHFSIRKGTPQENAGTREKRLEKMWFWWFWFWGQLCTLHIQKERKAHTPA